MIKLKSLLIEQSGIWTDIQATSNGFKEVSKSFASVPCMDPKSGKQFAVQIDNEKQQFLYIGASSNMIYREGGAAPKSETDANNKPYFQFTIIFYFSYIKGQTDYTNANNYDITTPKAIWGMRCNKLSDGKFYGNINNYTIPYDSQAYAVNKLNDKDRSVISNLLKISTSVFPTNIKGAAPGLLAQINTELAKYGYPDMPSTIKAGKITL